MINNSALARIKVLEEILERLEEYSKNVTMDKYLAQATQDYIHLYTQRLEAAKIGQARGVVDYKLRDLTEKLK